ncbi:MAG: hypothetical protein NTW13_05965 [Candidatus Omnitrophica bacterium]|nr:hypothetical protein [Candidatus Omnitrophota bacterium]
MKSYLRSFIYIQVICNFILVSGLNAAPLPPLLIDKDVTISMDFQDASIKDVIKVLSIQSGLNFIASEAVKDRKITLYMDKVPLKEAMDKIFKANNLSYELNQDAKVFIVKDWGKPAIETVTKVFYLKHATVSSASMKEEMKNIISSNNTNNINTLTNAQGGTSSSNSTSSSSSSSGGDEGKWKVEQDAGITNSVKKLLSEYGSVIEDFRTNSLVVTDIPSRMDVIAQVIASLDISVAQVMLEVEILDVSKNVVDAIGFKFGQTPLSVLITGAQANLGFPYHSWAKTAINGGFGSVDINNTASGGGYKAQLDFLRTQTDTKYLARPKILALNNETSEIKIVTNEAIGVITTVASAGGSSGTQTTEAERFETGVSLRVTPQVDVDLGEITMFIYPQVSESSTQAVTLTSGTGSYQFYNPEIRSTKSTVRIKDGETVVLGGLIRNQNSTVITKLPILGDIPLLGALFRHKNQSPGKDRELLVFITPHILKDRNTDLPKSKTLVLPQREQATVSVINRRQSMNTYLNNFETKQR